MSKFAPSFVITLWMGMICGVSFFAAPIKFLIPDLSRELALQLGDLSFRYFNYIEWLLAISLMIFLIKNKEPYKFVFVLLAILALDSFYLLPALHDYVVSLVSLEPLKFAHDIAFYHRFYVLAEFAKLIIQFILLFQLNKPCFIGQNS